MVRGGRRGVYALRPVRREAGASCVQGAGVGMDIAGACGGIAGDQHDIFHTCGSSAYSSADFGGGVFGEDVSGLD